MGSDGVEWDGLGGAGGAEERVGSGPGLCERGEPVPGTAEVGRSGERGCSGGAGTEACPGEGTGAEDVRGEVCKLGKMYWGKTGHDARAGGQGTPDLEKKNLCPES